MAKTLKPVRARQRPLKPNQIDRVGDVVYMTLTQGKVAYLDSSDYELVKAHRWHAHFNGFEWYPMTRLRSSDGTTETWKLHQMLMPVDAPLLVDHGDGNGLNNRRYNLRKATIGQNNFNAKKHRGKGSTSKHTGVSWDKRRDHWIARIAVNKKMIHLGSFGTESEAYHARKAAEATYYPGFEKRNCG